MIFVRPLIKLLALCGFVFVFLVLFQYGPSEFGTNAAREWNWVKGNLPFGPASSDSNDSSEIDGGTPKADPQ